MSTSGIAGRHSDKNVRKSYSTCGEMFDSKTYEKVINCPAHRIKPTRPGCSTGKQKSWEHARNAARNTGPTRDTTSTGIEQRCRIGVQCA